MVEEKELDLDTTKQAPDKKKNGKLILLVVLIMLVLSGSIVGALYYFNNQATESEEETDQAETAKPAKDSTPPPPQNKPALYVAIQPALVANFEVQTAASYLQIDMSLMARDQHVLDVAKEHMPVIRNNVLMIMSAQKYEVVTTRAGKEQLRQSILEAVQQVVATGMHGAGDKHKENDKEKPKTKDKAQAKSKEPEPVANIESVYFTSFIIQ